MLKRASFYVVFVLLVAMLMNTGCAKQEVVKKDEGIASAPNVKQVDPPKTNVTTSKQENTSTATQVSSPHAPASAQQAQKALSIDQLQSALDKIYFDFDSAGLSESARGTLTKNAAVLTKEPTVKIRIEGNCDERGSSEYNLALGERRAKAAQQYLVTLGIKPDRLSIISYGKEKPAVRGDDESAWARNRRDEFVVVTH